ncbi:hypothetical protein ACWDTQ_15295 [Streptomyces cellulosae]|uniref:hypothetical protein n=1 Tax=Streptomyces sp. UNC401CLCol TaxID=1449077 RepID=UPI0005650944
MGLDDIRYDHIIAATEELRRLGRDAFLRTYGFGRARSYELVLDGSRYDSKVIAGVAHGYATGVTQACAWGLHHLVAYLPLVLPPERAN